MKSSPIQLLESYPEKIFVEISDEYDSEMAEGRIEKLDIQVLRGIEPFPEYVNEDPSFNDFKDRIYQVTLGIRTPEGRPTGPYVFEFVVSGVIVCIKEVKNRIPEDLAFEYGLTILYGVIREQFASVSARMRPGIRFLPTVNFLGEKASDIAIKANPLSDKKSEVPLGTKKLGSSSKGI